MSKNSGDKARFGKERKKKLLRRKRTLSLQQSLATATTTEGQGLPPESSVAAVNQPDLS